METTIEPKDQIDKWIARLVPGKSFVDIGGVGEKAINERITFAHLAGARSCVMADIMPTSHDWWDSFRNKCTSLGLAAFEELGGVDVRLRDSMKALGKVDVVHSTGIFYHLSSVPDALWSLRSIVGEHLITNTITFPERPNGTELSAISGSSFMRSLRSLWVGSLTHPFQFGVPPARPRG